MRRRREAEVALLLDRRRLGVALRDDDAAQVGAVLAGHVLPGLLALVVAEVDLPLGVARLQEDAPAVVAHLHVVEVRPALRVDARRGAQVDLVVGRALGADVVPPVDEVRLPLLERALQRAVVGEVDVVGDLLRCSRWPWCSCSFRQTRVEVEAGLLAGAVDLERALVADGVGPLEDPVLPRGEPAEDARRHVLLAGEAQVRFQAGERVGRHRGALLEGDADLVVPVDVVGRGGDEAELQRLVGVERARRSLPRRGGERRRFLVEAARQARLVGHHRQRGRS